MRDWERARELRIELEAKKKKEEEKIKNQDAQEFSRIKKLKIKKKRKRSSVRMSELLQENQSLKAELKKKRKMDFGFYDSDAWLKKRIQVLRVWGRKCMCCGVDAVEVHVDHIKPRSKYPKLELEFDNLQVLCRACNIGKSNNDEIDYRPHKIRES